MSGKFTLGKALRHYRDAGLAMQGEALAAMDYISELEQAAERVWRLDQGEDIDMTSREAFDRLGEALHSEKRP